MLVINLVFSRLFFLLSLKLGHYIKNRSKVQKETQLLHRHRALSRPYCQTGQTYGVQAGLKTVHDRHPYDSIHVLAFARKEADIWLFLCFSSDFLQSLKS